MQGYRLVIFLTAILMLYTLLIGGGLVSGLIKYQYAYLLIALACLAPVIAYSYGFLVVSDSEQDWGLLLSAVGWAFVAMALIVQHMALQNQLRDIENLPYGVLPGGLENGALVCLILAICFILGGAALSLQIWNRERVAIESAATEFALRETTRHKGY